MTFIPDWAPNIHPLLIHFPIVLLLIAPAFELGLILLKKRDGLVQMVNLLHLAAAVSVGLVYISGRIAADSVNIPTQAYTTISNHANLAFYTLIIALANGSFRGWLLIRKSENFTGTWFGLIPGLLALAMLIPTAEKGAKMVFLHGVGVSAMEAEHHHSEASATDHHHNVASEPEHHHDMEMEDHDHGHDTEMNDHEHEHEANTLDHNHVDSESLFWTASTSTLENFKHRFEWLITNMDDLEFTRVENENRASFLILIENQEGFILFPESVDNLELKAQLNIDQFDGVVRLVHHFSSRDRYDFLEINSTQLELGRIADGKKQIFDSANTSISGAVSLKAVGTEGHFRGYANEELLTHGHGPDFPAGQLGIYFKGKGKISLNELSGVEIK
ncbi:MAG: hypothetical protein HQ507_10770 [Candidatus Marinimicrobia bacterium]|nr:hypothetical protein [Candidatus Neomarinimicrobiota bacterium]